jgi:hypothetical protein
VSKKVSLQFLSPVQSCPYKRCVKACVFLRGFSLKNCALVTSLALAMMYHSTTQNEEILIFAALQGSQNNYQE